MKKAILFLVIFTALLATISFTACGGDVKDGDSADNSSPDDDDDAMDDDATDDDATDDDATDDDATDDDATDDDATDDDATDDDATDDDATDDDATDDDATDDDATDDDATDDDATDDDATDDDATDDDATDDDAGDDDVAHDLYCVSVADDEHLFVRTNGLFGTGRNEDGEFCSRFVYGATVCVGTGTIGDDCVNLAPAFGNLTPPYAMGFMTWAPPAQSTCEGEGPPTEAGIPWPAGGIYSDALTGCFNFANLP